MMTEKERFAKRLKQREQQLARDVATFHKTEGPSESWRPVFGNVELANDPVSSIAFIVMLIATCLHCWFADYSLMLCFFGFITMFFTASLINTRYFPSLEDLKRHEQQQRQQSQKVEGRNDDDDLVDEDYDDEDYDDEDYDD